MKWLRNASNGNGKAPSAPTPAAPFQDYLDGKIKSDEYFRRVKAATDKIVRRELATPRQSGNA
jgi:hypothetical protein